MTMNPGSLPTWTKSSVYEVDEKAKRIRRTLGLHPPTERVGVGSKPFSSVHARVGYPAEILWRVTLDGVFKMTLTTTVVAIEPLESLGLDQRGAPSLPGSPRAASD